MFRLNGESGDYRILQASAGTNVVTIDRPIVSRMRGVGVTGVGTGYSQVRWECSPPGRVVLRCLPTPSATKTINYRFLALPRKLLNADQSPEIQEEYHHLIWKGALRLVGAEKGNQTLYGMYAQEYAAALELLKRSDDDETPSDDAPRIERLIDRSGPIYPPGTYSRTGSGYGFGGY